MKLDASNRTEVACLTRDRAVSEEPGNGLPVSDDRLALLSCHRGQLWPTFSVVLPIDS